MRRIAKTDTEGRPRGQSGNYIFDLTSEQCPDTSHWKSRCARPKHMGSDAKVLAHQPVGSDWSVRGINRYRVDGDGSQSSSEQGYLAADSETAPLASSDGRGSIYLVGDAPVVHIH